MLAGCGCHRAGHGPPARRVRPGPARHSPGPADRGATRRGVRDRVDRPGGRDRVRDKARRDHRGVGRGRVPRSLRCPARPRHETRGRRPAGGQAGGAEPRIRDDGVRAVPRPGHPGPAGRGDVPLPRGGGRRARGETLGAAGAAAYGRRVRPGPARELLAVPARQEADRGRHICGRPGRLVRRRRPANPDRRDHPGGAAHLPRRAPLPAGSARPGRPGPVAAGPGTAYARVCRRPGGADRLVGAVIRAAGRDAWQRQDQPAERRHRRGPRGPRRAGDPGPAVDRSRWSSYGARASSGRAAGAATPPRPPSPCSA
jgi:hypothetical protein